jgi:superfamily II DNA or RNA helicase
VAIGVVGAFRLGVRLEDLTPGALVRGLVATELASVVQVEWYGESTLNVTYRTGAGQVGDRLLFRSDEPALAIAEPGSAFAFDGDPALYRLVSEARRIHLAHLFDPMLAVASSAVEPLPHQITALYRELLPRQPLRFLLADDPGAGKTIMAGLYIKELLLRGDLSRCLVVAPGSLVEQWQDELAEKFDVRFTILTRALAEAAQGNVFAEHRLLIARLDALSRSDELRDALHASDWDLVVVDEAHRMSAHFFGREVKKTRRYQLGEMLGGIARHLLLMTATPHAGKEEDFQLFLALLDADRFEGRPRTAARAADASDLMRRMVKEKLLRFDGTRLFPERRAYSVEYELSDAELELYEAVTRYVSEGMNRAEALAGRKRASVGFALTVLQRRLASSPEAIHQSLRRRRRRLTQRLDDLRLRRRFAELQGSVRVPAYDDDSLDDLDADERERLEEEAAETVTSAESLVELETEIAELAELERLAERVRNSGQDVKWRQLAGLLCDAPEMVDRDGIRRKVIVFTEHRDTLNYLVDKLRRLLGSDDAVVAIHGGSRRDLRRTTQERFTQDRDVVILVATDAAGEGINLQRAHLLVNYDLPWNPNRIEQRFGRIHRIGQTEVCHAWNLVASQTREGHVYKTLLDKIEEQRKAYDGQVFDVLGQAFEGTPLRDLLIAAVRYGDQPQVRARLEQVVDERVREGLEALIAAEALEAQVLAAADVDAIRRQMEEAQARRLQPHYLQAFFLESLRVLGGRAVEREPGRFELSYVPAVMRQRDRQIGHGAAMLPRYQRVTFRRELVRVAGKPLAELVAPGHPLLNVAVDLLLDQYRGLLKRGAVLVDEDDPGEQPRVLVALDHVITDGRPAPGGGHLVVSRRVQYVAARRDGDVTDAGWAPYLDLRPVTDAELLLLTDLCRDRWLREDLEPRALAWAASTLAPRHLAEVRERTLARVDRVAAAVQARLRSESAYWDHRALELFEQQQAGRQPRMNRNAPGNAPTSCRRGCAGARRSWSANASSPPGHRSWSARRWWCRLGCSTGCAASGASRRRRTPATSKGSSGARSTRCSPPNARSAGSRRSSRATTPATTSARTRHMASRCSSRSRAACSEPTRYR